MIFQISHNPPKIILLNIIKHLLHVELPPNPSLDLVKNLKVKVSLRNKKNRKLRSWIKLLTIQCV
jgi:hypothetical protein